MNFDMKNLYLGLADHRIRANLMAIANPRYICTYVVSSRCVIINRMSNTLTPQSMLMSPPPPPLPPPRPPPSHHIRLIDDTAFDEDASSVASS